MPVGRADQVVAEAGKTLEAAVARDRAERPSAAGVKLKAVETPKTIEISFGLKISVEAGAIIAKKPQIAAKLGVGADIEGGCGSGLALIAPGRGAGCREAGGIPPGVAVVETGDRVRRC